jgi:adenylate cyclase
MGADAEGTLATLRRIRAEIIDPVVAAKHGRIAKSMGDGWIVVFSTVAGSVECAMQMQDRLKVDGSIQLRIGVHVGDLAEADEDLFGEGINVAARLQECADPSAIAISGTVRDLIDGTLRPSFDDAGERSLKNIAEPVRVWTRGGDVSAASARLVESGLPSLEIRPVATGDERADMREIATALTGDLATYLDSVSWLSARVSSGECGTDYTLDTKLRSQGDRVRLEARLSDHEGREAQYEKFDGSLTQGFDWQDEVGAKLATRILTGVVADQSAIIEAIPVAERNAEQWTLLSLSGSGANAEYFRYALDCLAEAIRLSPDWAYPYTRALAMLTTSVNMGYRDAYEPFVEQRETWADAVDRLEPAQAASRIILALGRLAKTGSQDAVRAEVRGLLRRQPFDPELRFYSGWLHMYLGEPEDGIALITGAEVGLSLELYGAPAKGALSIGYLQMGRNEDALGAAEAAAKLDPDYLSAYRFQAAALAHLGRMDEAAVALSRLPQGESISSIRARAGYVENDATRRVFDGLRKAGLPER